MKMKKVLTAVIAASIICTAMTGCTQSDVKKVNGKPETTTQEVGQDTATVAVEEATTQAETTTKAGETTATTATTAATTAATTTTAKAATTTKKSTQTTAKTTTKAASKTTTKKTATTTKSAVVNKTTTKKATTQAAVSTTQANTDITITLGKNGTAVCSSSNVTIDAPSGLQTDGIISIEKGGNYIIKSSSNDVWHGQIIVKLANTDSAELRFENVNISTSKANAIKILDANITAERTFIEADISSTNSTTGTDGDNALQDQMKEVAKIQKAPNVDLSFPTGTKSSFTTTSNNMSGVIYNESKLTIKGNGNVDVITNPKSRNNAICSTKSVTFKNVSATLETANNDVPDALSSARGIFSFSKVIVESGRLIIRSNGDGIRCEEFSTSGGTTNISSSACDGIDADDAIVVTGGSLTAVALKKSAFKVRRVNNQENLNAGDKTVQAKDGITKADHTFRIDGGTVVGEGKNMTTPKKRSDVQTLSKQACIYSRSVAANSEIGKLTLKFTIKNGNDTVASSSNNCYKYLYSSSSVDSSKSYTVSGKNGTKTYSGNVTFSSNFGDCRITAG